MENLETLKLENICDGSLPELFERELAALLENISDANTDPEKKRKITVEFTFEPFPDRSGARIELRCSTKLAGVQTVKSNMFIHRAAGKTYALPRDARQQQMFGPAGSQPKQEERPQ